MLGVNRRLMLPVKDQLRIANSCKQLGYIDPVSATGFLSASKGILGDSIGKIEEFLGIGSGRREADLIVPTQNRIFSTVIVPVYDELKNPSGLSSGEITDLINRLNEAETEWLAFLHDPRWTDGRAASQAEATLKPYFDGAREGLRIELNKRGMVSNFFGTVSTSPMSLAVPALIGAAVFFFSKKGR